MMMIRRSGSAVLIAAAFGLAAAPMAWADQQQGGDDTVLDVVDNVIIETWGPPPATPAVPTPQLPPGPQG